jgi:hypothetical protein
MHQLRIRNTGIAILFISLRCTIYINSPRIHGGYHMISAFSSNGTAGENKTMVRAPLLQACSSSVLSTPVSPALLDPCLLWVHRGAGESRGGVPPGTRVNPGLLPFHFVTTYFVLRDAQPSFRCWDSISPAGESLPQVFAILEICWFPLNWILLALETV